LDAFPDAEFVHFHVFKRFLWMTQMPDANERIAIGRILNHYFAIRDAERANIVVAIWDIIISFTELALVPVCVTTLLFCLKHALVMSLHNYRDLFKNVILQAIVPLIASQYLPLFFLGMKSFLTAVLPLLRDPIFREFQRRWKVAQNMGRFT
jgi:hypothetical protein